MAGKKGEIPAHVTEKQFNHPGVKYPVIQILNEVEDPRQPSLFFVYSLTSVLFMTLIAVLCGGTDWPKVVVIATSMKDWLGQYVDMKGGVPCERTFKTIFNSINPTQLEEALRALSSAISKPIPNDVISFDGQTARGTADKYKDLRGIHLLHAWSSGNGICLGQLTVDEKSNEITATPRLMDLLDLKETIITADALNTQKDIAAKAIEREADYLLPVKKNHPSLYENIDLIFESLDQEQDEAKSLLEYSLKKARAQRDESRLQQLLSTKLPKDKISYFETVEKNRGRIEIRECTAIPVGLLPDRDLWKNLTSLVRIDRKRIQGEKESSETTYYITSLPADANVIANAARLHWGVENNLHWRLDVVLRQDKSRYRDRIGASNLAVIRKFALHALSREDSLKGGVATKQCAACCDPEYRTRVIKNLF